MTEIRDPKDNKAKPIDRRTFCQTMMASVSGFLLSKGIGEYKIGTEAPDPLLPPIVTGNSTELCFNSRASQHNGLNGPATDQQIANVLWAAGRAPVVGSYRTIYLTTPVARYIYHPEDHTLEFYSNETVTNAFRLSWDRELDFDAGISFVSAMLASVSLWTGTESQLACCPQGASQTALNFGIRSVPGLTNELVAVSSDLTLSDPRTDHKNNLEDVLLKLRLHSNFWQAGDLTLEQLSQILWAGYGCTPHTTNNGRAGLNAPSSYARYFLTNRIYVVQDQVLCYCNRVGADLTTRDHRLELVLDADVRNEIRAAFPDIPEAPCYILLCPDMPPGEEFKAKLETGFAAGGILVQSTAMWLGCDFRTPLSPEEQEDLKLITQIPDTEDPFAVVSVGHLIPHHHVPVQWE